MENVTPCAWSEETWRVDILRCQLRVRTELVKRLADKLEHSEDFPTDAPPKLCQLIKQTAKAIGEYLPQTPPDQLNNVNVFVCDMSEHLRFVERSRIANTPWSMIQSAEAFLKRYSGDKSNFIIRPQWAYNYSLRSEFIEVYRTKTESLKWIPTNKWEEAIGLIAKEKIYCVSFPRVERLNALLHANWGHEVGHIIAASWITNHFDPLWQSQQTLVKTVIEKEVQATLSVEPILFKEEVIQEIVAEKVNGVMEATKEGLRELICDAIGVHLFGPAALAAAAEFSSPFALDESPLKCGMYPPWRYRLRLMLDACASDLKEYETTKGASHNYPGLLIQPFWTWLNEIRNLTMSQADTQSLQSNVKTREAYKIIENKWSTILKEALQPLCSTKPYRLHEQVHIIADLVDKLEQYVPPGELGKYPSNSPATFEDILNAAWVFKIRKMKTDPKWGSPDDFECLYRLVLKGIECSFVQQTFGGRLKEVTL